MHANDPTNIKGSADLGCRTMCYKIRQDIRIRTFHFVILLPKGTKLRTRTGIQDLSAKSLQILTKSSMQYCGNASDSRTFSFPPPNTRGTYTMPFQNSIFLNTCNGASHSSLAVPQTFTFALIHFFLSVA